MKIENRPIQSQPSRLREASHRAAALPLVLWAIVFVSSLIVMATLWMSQRLEDESQASRLFRARQLALRGMAFGMHPAVSPGDPLLKSGDEDEEGYSVRIFNETGRINPNSVVNPENRELFRTLFASWDVPLDQADAAIDSLYDWVSEGELPSLHGAKRADYEALGLEGMPPNAPITNVREMAYVLNLRDILAQREGWQEFFTVWSTGKINIRYASHDLLRDLGGLTDDEIERLTTYILGPDGIIDTQDDGPLATIEDAIAVAGIPAARAGKLLDYFDVQGDIRRIESTGFCYGARYELSVIIVNNQPLAEEEE